MHRNGRLPFPTPTSCQDWSHCTLNSSVWDGSLQRQETEKDIFKCMFQTVNIHSPVSSALSHAYNSLIPSFGNETFRLHCYSTDWSETKRQPSVWERRLFVLLWYSVCVAQHDFSSSFVPIFPSLSVEMKRVKEQALAMSQREKAYPGQKGLCIESIRAAQTLDCHWHLPGAHFQLIFKGLHLLKPDYDPHHHHQTS